MMRARHVLLTALLTLIAVGTLFGQARDFVPPTPAERLEQLTGYRPQPRSPEFQVYAPRRFSNPFMEADGADSSDRGFLGRSPFVVYDYPRGLRMEDTRFWEDSSDPVRIEPPAYSGEPAYTPVLDLTQYMLQFEFETPRFISVRHPDGSARQYWYMVFRAINHQPYPVRASLDFKVKTLTQDIFPEPNQPESERRQMEEQLLAQFVRYSFYGPEMSAEDINRMNEYLLNRFSGRSADELARLRPGERDRLLSRIRSELLRGIQRSLAVNYLNYSDRYLMDAICDQEQRWQDDEYGRRYNPLVPAHLLMLRRRLMPQDDKATGYIYPDITLQDVDSGIAYIVTPQYNGPDAPTGFEVTICEPNSEPRMRRFDSLESLASANLGTDGRIRVLPEARFQPDENTPDYAEVPFVDALLRYWPRYRPGDRVDAYGFRLPPGHPEYERGILIRSDHTIMKLHGARYVDIQRGRDGRIQTGSLAGMSVAEGVVRVNRDGLPQIGDTKLITANVVTLLPILQSFKSVQNLAPTLYEQVQADIEFVTDRFDSGAVQEDEVAPRIRRVVTHLLDLYQQQQAADRQTREAGGEPDVGAERLPLAVTFDLERLVLRQSRVTFMEAHEETARVVGFAHEPGYLWQAQFHPAECFVKFPTPRRYQEGQHVLLNYRLPTEPLWQMPEELDWGQQLYRPIGEDEASHSFTVSGVVLEPYEYSADRESRDPTREPVNRYGQRAASGAAIEDTYAGATVEVRSGQEPYFDTTWGRDEAGRPIKRIDSFGRSMRAGTRVYRVGDRVTPMEWKAYGSLLPENLLREWAAGGGYEPQREYLNYGDLLVGQPRLVLAEFRYDSRRVASGELELWPLGRMITRDGRVQPLTGETEMYVRQTGEGSDYWRNGFRCDAAGDYDAIVWEELSPVGRERFRELLANTLQEESMDEGTRAQRSFLKLVPQMDRTGVAVDYVHPITHERIPQRVHVLPPGDQAGQVLRDPAGNPVFAKAYETLPYYLYEYEYEAISQAEAEAVAPQIDRAVFDMARFRDEAGRDRGVRNADDYWAQPEIRRHRASRFVGLPKVSDVPTLGPARLNVNFQRADRLLIDRDAVQRVIPRIPRHEIDRLPANERGRIEPEHRFDRLYLRDLTQVDRIVSARGEPLRTERDPSIRGENVILFGRIINNALPNHIEFEVERELLPTVAEGVAIFGELNRRWDYMNLYVYGIKGPVQRRGFGSLEYSVEAVEPGARPRTRFEHTPQVTRENWVLQLRFERLGSSLNAGNQRVRFIRRYWYLDELGTDPESNIRPLRDR